MTHFQIFYTIFIPYFHGMTLQNSIGEYLFPSYKVFTWSSPLAFLWVIGYICWMVLRISWIPEGNRQFRLGDCPGLALWPNISISHPLFAQHVALRVYCGWKGIYRGNQRWHLEPKCWKAFVYWVHQLTVFPKGIKLNFQ